MQHSRDFMLHSSTSGLDFGCCRYVCNVCRLFIQSIPESAHIAHIDRTECSKCLAYVHAGIMQTETYTLTTKTEQKTVFRPKSREKNVVRK